jgi:peptidyl-dipeptidase A
VPADEARAAGAACARAIRDQLLVQTRWMLVMCHMERALYRDPAQDLDALWWDLVEEFQRVRRPDGRRAPDWASKVHFSAAPVYYHNYMLGEMMASQLLHTMAKEFTGSEDIAQLNFASRMELGKFLIDKIFRPGASLRWDELLVQATGETLNPKYFAQQFL